LLFMARAQAKLGRLVAAHETYLKITRETLAPNAPKAFVSAQDAAEQEQDALDARLPSITVTLQGATTAPDTVVQMDGTALPAAMIGIPLPADPGEHVFKATGPWIASDPVTIKLAEAAKQTVTLKLRSTGTPPATVAAKPDGSATQPATTPAHNAPVAATAATASGANSAPPSEPKGNDSGSNPAFLITSIAAFTLGAASAGVGTYYMLKASDTRNNANELNDKCNVDGGGTCLDTDVQDQIRALDKDANHQTTLGAIGLAGGGVGLLAGTIFLIVHVNRSDRSAASNSTPHVMPVFGLQSVGVVGTF